MYATQLLTMCDELQKFFPTANDSPKGENFSFWIRLKVSFNLQTRSAYHKYIDIEKSTNVITSGKLNTDTTFLIAFLNSSLSSSDNWPSE